MRQFIKNKILDLGWKQGDQEFDYIFQRAIQWADLKTETEMIELIDELAELVPLVER